MSLHRVLKYNNILFMYRKRNIMYDSDRGRFIHGNNTYYYYYYYRNNNIILCIHDLHSDDGWRVCTSVVCKCAVGTI